MKKGRKYVNKDGVNKVIDPSELDKWLSEGWVLGNTNASHPGNPAWNKGLTKETSGSVKKISDSKLGVPRDEQTKRKLSEANKGKVLTEEHKSKISNSLKGIIFSEERCKNISMSKLGHEVTQETKDKISNSCKGRIVTEETKTKISNSLAGKQFSKEHNLKISKTRLTIEFQDKINKIKLQNGTFNTSKPEQQYYGMLIEKYGENNVLRQYRDNRYPFSCDFYVVSEDKFIECNFHWTHGGHPFDSTNKQDVDKANMWLEKGTKYYKIAYYVWTQLDVKKQHIAKKNNLNYEVIYNL